MFHSTLMGHNWLLFLFPANVKCVGGTSTERLSAEACVDAFVFVTLVN